MLRRRPLEHTQAPGAAQRRSDAFDEAGYEEVVPIGFGAAATVYRARQTAFDRMVAVKVLTRADASLLRRFDREKRMLGRLSNQPSIAVVFDAGVTGSGAPYLVMQYHPGGSLADLVRRHGPQRAERVLQIGVDLAATLDAAHTLGVLHRDIKPGNVLLDVMQRPVLADFGIAALATGAGGHTAGLTYHYAAPEVVNDPTAASTASDQYSLALTLRALLVGRTPWHDLASRQLAPLPDDVPAEVAAALARALAPAPQDRYPTCLAFAEALRDAQEALGVPAPAVPRLAATPVVDLDGDTAAPRLAAAEPAGTDGGRAPSVRAPSRARKRLAPLALLVALAFTVGSATAVLERSQAAPAAPELPLAAPTGVAAALDGDTIVVTWDDTNGGRLPYFVYRTGSGEAALMTDPGARAASFALLPGGSGMCFRVGVLDATRAATSDEACADGLQ